MYLYRFRKRFSCRFFARFDVCFACIFVPVQWFSRGFLTVYATEYASFTKNAIVKYFTCQSEMLSKSDSIININVINI